MEAPGRQGREKSWAESVPQVTDFVIGTSFNMEMILGTAAKTRKAEEKEDKIHQAAAEPTQASPTPPSQAGLCFPARIFLPQPPNFTILLLQVVRAQILSVQLLRPQPGALCPQAAVLHPKTSQMEPPGTHRASQTVCGSSGLLQWDGH